MTIWNYHCFFCSKSILMIITEKLVKKIYSLQLHLKIEVSNSEQGYFL